MVRNALQSLYNDSCTVTVKTSYKRDNLSTGYKDNVLYSDLPCKLSFSNAVSAQPPTNGNANDTAQATFQQIKLFLSPDVDIPPGSKITVTHRERTVDYQRSGVPAIFTNHQEILLELFKQWA